MRRLVMAALAVLSWSVAAPAATNASSCSAAFVSKADAALQSYREKSGAPGVAVAFFENGHSCVLVSGVSGRGGPITPETAFGMGSVQKLFNATLLATDIVQGKATIDDPAAKYLVAANGQRVSPGAAFARITLRNLATHTASLPDSQHNAPERDGFSLYRDAPMPASMMAYLNAWTPPYPPGTRYSYSNLGFVVLAHVATTLAKAPYTTFLADAVTKPLGMPRTARPVCDQPDPSCAVGHTDSGAPAKRTPVGLWTSAQDMLAFIEANLGALKVPDLQARAIALTHQELFRENQNHAVGMAWEILHSGDALLLSKNGEDAGFTSWVGIEPNRHHGVAVLSNGTGKPPPANLGQELPRLAGEPDR